MTVLDNSKLVGLDRSKLTPDERVVWLAGFASAVAGHLYIPGNLGDHAVELYRLAPLPSEVISEQTCGPAVYVLREKSSEHHFPLVGIFTNLEQAQKRAETRCGRPISDWRLCTGHGHFWESREFLVEEFDLET